MRALLLSVIFSLGGCCLENSCPHDDPRPKCNQYEFTTVDAVAATTDGGAVVLTTHTSDKTATEARLRKLDGAGHVVWVTSLGTSFAMPTGDARLAVLPTGAVVVWLGGHLGGFDANGGTLWDMPARSMTTPSVFAPASAQAVQIVVNEGTRWRSYLVQLDGTTTSDLVLAFSRDSYQADLERTSDGGFMLVSSDGVLKVDSQGAAQWNEKIPGSYSSFLSHEVADGYLVLSNITDYSGLLVSKVSKDGATTSTLFHDDNFMSYAQQPFAVQSDAIATGEFNSSKNDLYAYNLDGSRRFTHKVDMIPTALVPAAAGGYLFPYDDSVGTCHSVAAVTALRPDGSTAWQAALEP
jgi:hypothetical protein